MLTGRQLPGCLATRRQPVHPGERSSSLHRRPFRPRSSPGKPHLLPWSGSRGARSALLSLLVLFSLRRERLPVGPTPRVELHPLAPMPGRGESSGCRWLELCRCSQVASAATAPGAVKFYARKSQGLCGSLVRNLFLWGRCLVRSFWDAPLF